MAYASWSVVANEQPSTAKWNILGTNDAYFDGLVGSGTAWTSYVGAMKANGGTAPTYTSTDVGKYQVIGKTCRVQVCKTNAAGGTAGAGAVTMLYTLPVAANTSTTAVQTVPCGSGVYLNTGVGSAGFIVYVNSSTDVAFRDTGASPLLNTNQSATIRQLFFSFTYEIA